MKTLLEWEKELGFIDTTADSEDDLKRQIDKKQAIKIWMADTSHKVIYEQRVQFLKDNGYDVTRKNMIDHTLPAKA